MVRRAGRRLARPAARSALSGAALAIIGGATVAQEPEIGHPLVRCIPPTEYDGGLQIFDAAQTPDGLLHFACAEDFTVLRYDGERWRKFLLPVPPVSLDADEEGRIWVGSSDDFGFLRMGASRAEFVSLAGAVVEHEPVLLSFVKTRCTSQGVFFLSKEVLVQWNGQHERTWKAPAESGFMDVEELGTDVFVLGGEEGLRVLADGELLESDALGVERVRFDALWSDGEELLGVWLNADGLNWIRSGVPGVSTLHVPELLHGPTYVSDVVRTREGTLVVSSANGILLVDAAGRFQAWLDDDAGLPNSLAYSLLLDREGAVWANLSYGLARIEPSPTRSFFGEELGLMGTPIAFARHGEATYCCTYEGLFRLVPEPRAHFERVEPVPSQPVYDVLDTSQGLLLATEAGLLLWDGSRRSMLSQTQPLAFAHPNEGAAGPEEAEESVIVAGFDALQTLRWREQSGWTFAPPFPVSWSTDQIVASEQFLWVHSFDHELFRVPYDGDFGTPVPVAGEWLGVTAVPGGCLAWNCERLVFLFDGSEEPVPYRPAASLDWAELQRSSRWVRPQVDTSGRLWLLEPHSLRRLQGDLVSGLADAADLAWASPLALEGAQFDELDPRVVWLGTHEGVMRLEPEGLRPAPTPDPLVWPSARTSAEAWGPFPAGALPYDASVRVDVSAVSFDGTPTTYRYRLAGLEHDWGAWTAEAQKEYTSLPGGEFVLHVQARKQGRVPGESRLVFAVLAPWYATWPAVLAGLGVLAACIVGGVRWRSARLARENARLGRLVAERVHDLQAVQARVLEHAAELERVNDRLVHEIEAREAGDRAQRDMHVRLEKAERLESLGVMAAGIAHDFNNYLTSILGYAQIALDERGTREERVDALGNVTLIARQAAELCSGMVSLSGRTASLVEPVELSQTVRGMESLLRSSVKDRGALRLELAGALPAIAGDSGQLRRALVNLVINAAEASQHTSSPIVVRTGTAVLSHDDLARMHRDGEREAGLYVWVEVEDEGAGMTADSLHHLFDPFFSTKHVGRGLGLTTVFRIVSSHGGAIDVQTTLGRGTCVRLLFPRSAVLRPAPPERAPVRKGAALAGRILVVDDDESVRHLSALFCRRLGLDVATAANGPDALARLESTEEAIDAVLLDLSMPGMDGLAVLAEIRRSRPHLPVLLVSGYADRLPPAPDGATRFLPKPFSLETVAAALQQTMECAPALERSAGRTT